MYNRLLNNNKPKIPLACFVHICAPTYGARGRVHGDISICKISVIYFIESISSKKYLGS